MDPEIVGLSPAHANVLLLLGKSLYLDCLSPPMCKMGSCLGIPSIIKYLPPVCGCPGHFRQLMYSVGSGNNCKALH